MIDSDGQDTKKSAEGNAGSPTEIPESQLEEIVSRVTATVSKQLNRLHKKTMSRQGKTADPNQNQVDMSATVLVGDESTTVGDALLELDELRCKDSEYVKKDKLQKLKSKLSNCFNPDFVATAIYDAIEGSDDGGVRILKELPTKHPELFKAQVGAGAGSSGSDGGKPSGSIPTDVSQMSPKQKEAYFDRLASGQTG